MALDFLLDMDTTASADEIAAVVHDDLVRNGDRDSGDAASELVGEGIGIEKGTYLRVGEVRPHPLGSTVAQLGVEPTVWVYYRVDGHEDVAPQQDLAVRSTMAVLRCVAGNLALRYLGENVFLVRRDGSLQVSDDDDLWPASRLALVTSPYERVPLTLD